jgi:hypothetical protein
LLIKPNCFAFTLANQYQFLLNSEFGYKEKQLPGRNLKKDADTAWPMISV